MIGNENKFSSTLNTEIALISAAHYRTRRSFPVVVVGVIRANSFIVDFLWLNTLSSILSLQNFKRNNSSVMIWISRLGWLFSSISVEFREMFFPPLNWQQI